MIIEGFDDLYVVIMQTKNGSEVCFKDGRVPFVGHIVNAINLKVELEEFCAATDVEYRIAKLSFLD